MCCMQRTSGCDPLTEDIKFAVVGPVVADHPVCGPRRAAMRHGVDVGDEEGAGVVRLLRLDTNTGARIGQDRRSE